MGRWGAGKRLKPTCSPQQQVGDEGRCGKRSTAVGVAVWERVQGGVEPLHHGAAVCGCALLSLLLLLLLLDPVAPLLPFFFLASFHFST